MRKPRGRDAGHGNLRIIPAHFFVTAHFFASSPIVFAPDSAIFPLIMTPPFSTGFDDVTDPVDRAI